MVRPSRRLPLLALLIGVGMVACGPEPSTRFTPPATLPPVDSTPAAADTVVGSGAPEPLSLPSREVAPAGSGFPHDPHVEISCTSCHEGNVHGTHGTESCTACHEASGPATAAWRNATESECMACHHERVATGTGPGASECSGCHGMDEVPVLQVSGSIQVANGPRRERDLPFSHARHESATCVACHTAGVRLTVERDCASCHESHHAAPRDCARCHAAPPTSAHGPAVHLGCGGTGCHERAPVTTLQDSRSTCLVCHREEVDHEPGAACDGCHQIRSVAADWFTRSTGGRP